MKRKQVEAKSKILENLNPNQEKAITFGNGPLLIIAGAGTGKTTVLTRRIAWLIEQGFAKPEEILALTFTVKATEEMEERVDQLMPLGYSEITISTFDSFAEKILRQHALDIGLPGDFKILNETSAWILLHDNLYNLKLDYYKPKGNPTKFIKALLKHFEMAKREGVTSEQYLDYANGLQLNLDDLPGKKTRKKKKELVTEIDPAEISRIQEVANAFHIYQKLLLDNSYLDFRDLTNYTLKLFEMRPKILKFYQEKYKYILVDEFQDTDLAQYDLVKLLSKPQNNITVVGDDDQSIYKFRGASISNIMKFKEDFTDATEITLTDNYRSTQAILDLSYEFIQRNNPYRLESKLDISKKLVSHKEETGEIKVIHTGNFYDEARQVADKILELQQKNNLSLNEFAILVRANDHAEIFLSELSKRGIPYIFVASRGLYRKPLILDLLSYLRLLDNFLQNEYFFRILNLKKFRFDHSDLVSITHTASRKALSIYEVLKDLGLLVRVSEDSTKKINELLITLDRHCKAAKELPISELFVRIIRELDIADDLREDSVENVENRNLLEQFYRKIQDYASENKDRSLKAFLNHIQLELEAGDTGTLTASADTGPEAVKVMTIHAAKGLEFACVFVVNMVDQRFPSRDRAEQISLPEQLVKEILPETDAHLMEERRLFYVATTRAKQFLYLTWSDDYGGTAGKKPSLLLIESGLETQKEKAKPAGQVFFAKQPTLNLNISEFRFRVPDTFDFSQISTFKKCPLEYKYKYMYKLPTPGAAALSFGSTIHNTLKKFLQHMIQINSVQQADLFGGRPDKILVPAKDLLIKYYEESWIDDWYDNKHSKEEYRKTGYGYLESFYNKISADPKIPKYLEQPFRMAIGKYKFKGRIDRADINTDGTLNIIDYKTGQARTKLEQVDKNQLLIYQWAAQEGFNEKVSNLEYWYLSDLNKTLPFKGEADDIVQLKDDLLNTIEEIVQTIETNSFTQADLRHSHPCRYRDMEA